MIQKYGYQLARIAEFMVNAKSATNPQACQNLLVAVRAIIGGLDLPISQKIIDRVLDESKKEGFSVNRMQHVLDSLTDELDEYWFKPLNKTQAELYDSPSAFGEAVADKFPEADLDISEAAKCLALERPLACMFHLMRIMEIGLRGFAGKHQIPVSDYANWGSIIKDLKPVIDALPHSSAAEKEAMQQAQEAYAGFQAVKLAWRNGYVHPRTTVSQGKAESVYRYIHAFMGALASHV